MSHGHSHAEPPAGERRWYAADGLHLDVRGLACPEPMVEILTAIERGELGTAAIVHLDQEPLMLYPELDERGWTHELVHSGGCGSGCGGVQLALRYLGA
jgi:hypothetical protein